jgi:hypothetical protein
VPTEHFFGQVVADEAVVSAELADELVGVGTPGHGQGGEVQARRPSLRAVHELGDVRRGQLDLLPLEESGCLIGDEREVCCTDLAELPTGAQATEAQTWVGTGRDQDMSPRRKMFDQEPDLVVASLLTHEMEVVENDDDLA